MYDRGLIFEDAKKLIKEHNLLFVEDIVSLLPISKPTFYDYFKVDSNEFNELRDLLGVNRTTIKVSLRKKWFESDNATLQMGLMKLVASSEEHKRLSQTYVDTTDSTPPEQRKLKITIKRDE
jgi:hypothetical protein